MNVLSEAAVKYLRGERRLPRLATVGSDGMPHVTPVGWSLSADGQAIEIGGMSLTRIKKFRGLRVVTVRRS
jgi:pyridoxamine 5'-phosphate oxidase family protein